jgi:hypothetical protein
VLQGVEAAGPAAAPPVTSPGPKARSVLARCLHALERGDLTAAFLLAVA